MKNIFVSLSLLISVLTVSCKKENEVKPQTVETVSTINIEYRIQSASGKVGMDYLMPNPNGTLQMVHAECSRTLEVINFDYTSGHNFSVSAYNLTNSHSVVQVQIYVNGVLKVENSTTGSSQNAFAEGNF